MSSTLHIDDMVAWMPSWGTFETVVQGISKIIKDDDPDLATRLFEAGQYNGYFDISSLTDFQFDLFFRALCNLLLQAFAVNTSTAPLYNLGYVSQLKLLLILTERVPTDKSVCQIVINPTAIWSIERPLYEFFAEQITETIMLLYPKAFESLGSQWIESDGIDWSHANQELLTGVNDAIFRLNQWFSFGFPGPSVGEKFRSCLSESIPSLNAMWISDPRVIALRAQLGNED